LYTNPDRHNGCYIKSVIHTILGIDKPYKRDYTSPNTLKIEQGVVEMSETGKGHWTRTHTKSGKDVLFWISDPEPPALRPGDRGTPVVYLSTHNSKIQSQPILKPH
jgi:hypothetical protein